MLQQPLTRDFIHAPNLLPSLHTPLSYIYIYRLKSSQYTLIIPYRVIHLITVSFRVPETRLRLPRVNKQVSSLESQWSIDTLIQFSFSLFLIHRRALFALNLSETRLAELGKYSQNMLSEAWTPKIYSSQFDEYPEIGSRNKSSPD